jgi:tol-pal system protein YbgF
MSSAKNDSGFLKMFKRGILVFALMTFAAVQSARADDVNNRLDQLDQQVRQLTGQIEELNYTIKQMQQASPAKQTMAAPVTPVPQPLDGQSQQAVATTQPVLKKKLVLQASKQVEAADAGDTGVETIGGTPVAATVPASPAVAPPPKVLGSMDNKAADATDGGFQGEVLVAPGSDGNAADVQQVAMAETPDDLFLRAEKSLLQLQYADAETGFQEFLTKYPDHNLAGSAEFKLGETFYAQQDYTSAAKAYLAGYKQFPKSRRAPDSLLKLGLSLGRLGQKDQGCAALGSVGDEYPNAVDVKKRAQAEYKRAGCPG